jgi:hypothetical protein
MGMGIKNPVGDDPFYSPDCRVHQISGKIFKKATISFSSNFFLKQTVDKKIKCKLSNQSYITVRSQDISITEPQRTDREYLKNGESGHLIG